MKRVIVAAPIKDAAALNVVVGVNDDRYDPKEHRLLTAASCTTNACTGRQSRPMGTRIRSFEWVPLSTPLFAALRHGNLIGHASGTGTDEPLSSYGQGGSFRQIRSPFWNRNPLSPARWNGSPSRTGGINRANAARRPAVRPGHDNVRKCPIFHLGIEHFQRAAAGVDFVVMGELGEAFEDAEQIFVPQASPDLDVAGAALRTERPEPCQLVATLRGGRYGEAKGLRHGQIF